MLEINRHGSPVNVVAFIGEMSVAFQEETSASFDLQADFYDIVARSRPIQPREDLKLELSWDFTLFSIVAFLLGLNLVEPKNELFKDCILNAMESRVKAKNMVDLLKLLVTLSCYGIPFQSLRQWQVDRTMQAEAKRMMHGMIASMLSFGHIRTHFAKQCPWSSQEPCRMIMSTTIKTCGEAGLMERHDVTAWEKKIASVPVVDAKPTATVTHIGGRNRSN